MAKKPPKRQLSTRLQSLQVELPSNDLCVLLANTAEPREVKKRAALGVVARPLQGYDDLVGWMGRMDGLSAVEVRELHSLANDDVPGAVDAFQRVLELRDVFLRMAGALAEKKSPAPQDFATVAAAVRELSPPLELVPTARDFTWAWAARGLTLEWPRRQLACSMAVLLSSDARAYVRRCAGKDCTVLFIDNTHTHRRRWCDMNACGNVLKVRRYRRQRPS